MIKAPASSRRRHSPVVYLDTQDFSRFGAVIQGKPDGAAASSFQMLKELADAEKVQFVYSMASLSELLQFHLDHEETSLAKARAIELLCRGHAMANVKRLVAYEVATFARNKGLMTSLAPWDAQCGDDYWFPNLGNVFADFRSKFEESRRNSLQGFAGFNRRYRRAAGKAMSDRSFKNFADNAARAVAADYGLPSSNFAAAFGMYARGRIGGEEASRRLFSSIAKPTAFIQFYFHKYDGKKDFPTWMRSAGESFQLAIEEMAGELSRFPLEEVRKFHRQALETWRAKLASTIVGFSLENGEEFGLTDRVIREVQSHSDILEIPCCANMVELIGEYVAQCIGLRGTKSNVEPSFGGDLIHAMYIPHVNVWRSDRRFSKLVYDCAVQGATTIVPTLTALPDVIGKLR